MSNLKVRKRARFWHCWVEIFKYVSPKDNEESIAGWQDEAI